MQRVHFAHPSEDRSPDNLLFEIVEANAEAEIPDGIRNVVPLCVDYNSRRVLEGISRRNLPKDFSLSLRGAIVLSLGVCLATALFCLFVLPRF